MRKPALIFWLDYPPHLAAGSFRYIADNWEGAVYFICARKMKIARKAMGWMDSDHGKATVIILADEKEPEKAVQKYIVEYHNAIHVCNGFRSLASGYFLKHLMTIPDSKVVMLFERPGTFENRLMQTIKKYYTYFFYRYYALRYNHQVYALLPFGKLGVKTMLRCGWPPDKLHPFMYATYKSGYDSKEGSFKVNSPLRIIYVGQFSWRKGVDLIINAFNEQISDQWQLDLAGKNGNYESRIVGWAQRHPNVDYLGIWPSEEVVQRLSQYDVCLVPSRFDGWGCTTNEAIIAGIGVIVSNNATSCDLVEASGAGIVIDSGGVASLRDAIQMVIKEPAIAQAWKERARSYASKIFPEVVGKYFLDVMEYTFCDSRQAPPGCPWL